MAPAGALAVHQLARGPRQRVWVRIKTSRMATKCECLGHALRLTRATGLLAPALVAADKALAALQLGTHSSP